MKFASGFGALLTTAGALSLLAGCASSPSSRFYTLGGDAPAASTMPASFYIEVPPVDMPPQVAKNQLVVPTSAAQVQCSSRSAGRRCPPTRCAARCRPT